MLKTLTKPSTSPRAFPPAAGVRWKSAPSSKSTACPKFNLPGLSNFLPAVRLTGREQDQPARPPGSQPSINLQGDGTVRFMMIVKANKDSEAGKMPSEELLAAMAKYNEELVNAGVLVDLAGLQSSAKGFRVRFSGAKASVIDGPFAETKELIAGYWIINVKSRQEAVDW